MTTKIINGTAGNDTITIDSNYEYTVSAGAGNDIIKVNYTTSIGGTYIGKEQNLFGGDGNDTVELVKGNEWLALAAFNPSNSIETIKGDGSGDAIVAAQNVQTGKAYGVLDLSSTTLINIAQIRGTSADDDITGSKGADTIVAGDGNDTIRESGGADVINGGTGTNAFVAKNALANYTGGYINADGSKSYNSGTSWKIIDSTGTTITLTNIQSVLILRSDVAILHHQ